MKQPTYYFFFSLISGIVLLCLFLFALIRADWPHVVFILPLFILHVVLSRKQLLPALFFFLFPFISFLATLGSRHTLNLYFTHSSYDKFVHLVTAFVITYFIGFLLQYTPVQKLKKDPFYLFVIVVCFGVTVGVFWEVFEWIHSFFAVINLNESIGDVITDLIIDAVGSTAAGLMVVRGLKRG